MACGGQLLSRRRRYRIHLLSAVPVVCRARPPARSIDLSATPRLHALLNPAGVLSQAFDLFDLEDKFPTMYEESRNTVLKQESFKYNRPETR